MHNSAQYRWGREKIVRKINIYLIIKRHNKNSADINQVFHVVLVFRGTSCSTIQTIIQPTVRAEQQTVSTCKHRLTKLKFVKWIGHLSEPLQPSNGVINDILVVLNSMVHTIRSYNSINIRTRKTMLMFKGKVELQIISRLVRINGKNLTVYKGV